MKAQVWLSITQRLPAFSAFGTIFQYSVKQWAKIHPKYSVDYFGPKSCKVFVRCLAFSVKVIGVKDLSMDLSDGPGLRQHCSVLESINA